jgi:hypothetical protein
MINFWSSVLVFGRSPQDQVHDVCHHMLRAGDAVLAELGLERVNASQFPLWVNFCPCHLAIDAPKGPAQSESRRHLADSNRPGIRLPTPS